MTKQEFLELQAEVSSSEKTLKSVLKEREIPYSTYNYWRNKISLEEGLLPMAPIAIKGSVPSVISNVTFGEVEACGVSLAFPNGLRAHFGRGSEPVLMELLNKSLGHVLPE